MANELFGQLNKINLGCKVGRGGEGRVGWLAKTTKLLDPLKQCIVCRFHSVYNLQIPRRDMVLKIIKIKNDSKIGSNIAVKVMSR